ncbi:hypothetical protein C2S51_016055 [Perilla frutescens var. frutescens]|nr:hypothetical protein C2S51_016055 [Perilla frutescens var. frutescens]
MTSWQSVIVRYGGQWESSEYVGGDEELTYIEADPLSLSSLTESVNRIMRANLLSFDYLLYYIARSCTGRTVKTLLSTDQDVIRLCAREEDPTVYVVHNQSTDGVTGPHEQSYIPSFNFSVPSSIVGCETGYEPSIDDIHKFYASDWFSETCFGSGSGIASGTCGPDPTPHYDDATWFTKYTFAEFVTWIRKEGGLNKLMSMLEPSQPPPINRDIGSPDAEEINNNWLIPIIPVAPSASLVVSDLDRMGDGQLRHGSTFWSKNDLKIAIGMWHMEHRAEYKVPISSRSRMKCICKHSGGCPFELRASARGDFWIVYKFVPEHTCYLDLGSVAPRQARARVIAAYFSLKMRNERYIMKPKEMQSELLQEFGIRISYHVAFRARNLAMEMIYGAHEKSFEMLPRYLYMLKEYNPEMVIVSDQHISISNAVKEVYPGTPYGICYSHLLNKIKRWGQGVVKMYNKAAYTYRPSVYEKAMASIKSTSPDAETFNGRLLWARRLPICSLIETIRHVIEQWFDERRRVANARIHDLTEEAVRKLSVEVQKSHTYAVKKCTQSTFKVNDGRRNFIVDLYAQKCQCGEFQEDRMPCSHAAAAIRDNGQHIYDYVETYYKTSTLRDTYELPIHSLPNPSEWVVPPDVAETIVLSPIITCQAGHPNMRRRRSHSETSTRRRKTCNICGEEGHTRRTCPFRVGEHNN